MCLPHFDQRACCLEGREPCCQLGLPMNVGWQGREYCRLQHPYHFVVRLANSKAGIKPTAPLSAFDKENSMEFSLDFLHYLYNYYMVCALFPHAYHVTHHVTSCDVTL